MMDEAGACGSPGRTTRPAHIMGVPIGQAKGSDEGLKT